MIVKGSRKGRGTVTRKFRTNWQRGGILASQTGGKKFLEEEEEEEARNGSVLANEISCIQAAFSKPYCGFDSLV